MKRDRERLYVGNDQARATRVSSDPGVGCGPRGRLRDLAQDLPPGDRRVPASDADDRRRVMALDEWLRGPLVFRAARMTELDWQVDTGIRDDLARLKSRRIGWHTYWNAPKLGRSARSSAGNGCSEALYFPATVDACVKPVEEMI